MTSQIFGEQAAIKEVVQASGVQVIGAGCGRTGTVSLKTALEILYGSPCYHMSDVMKHGHAPFWAR